MRPGTSAAIRTLRPAPRHRSRHHAADSADRPDAPAPRRRSQINLSWTASTDNVAVTGYRVERCQGAGCTNFAQVGAPAVAAFSDTGLAPGTSYRYRVRATDAAGNFSGYSNAASGTTPSAPDTTPPTAPTGLSASAAGAVRST